MSLIGSVSLTNNTNGLYLGQVNINNASEIGLTSNSIYINDNDRTIQSGIDVSTQGDCLYISAGSYGEPQINIYNKQNIALIAPNSGSTICEILNGIIIDGTSELIRLNNLQLEGANNQIFGIGRHTISNSVFQGFITQTNTVEIGKNSTQYITVIDSQFDQYCILSVSNLLVSVVYFINCNFGGASIILSQASPLQVIFNNCAGFVSFPANATYIGLNVLTSGISKVDTVNVNITTINNSAYPPPSSNLSCTSQAVNRIVSASATNDVLTANQFLTWDDVGLNLFNSNPLSIGRGNNAMSASTNSAIGVNALNVITSGTNNCTYGYNSGNLITSSSNNCIIGSSNTNTNSMTDGVCLGTSNTNSNDNAIVIGNSSKVKQSSITIGNSSGKTTGTYNIAIGRSSMNNVSALSGSYNLALGGTVLNSLTSGNYNLSIGQSSSTALSTGSNNCILGVSSGQILTSHNNNSIVGYNSSNSGTPYQNCSVMGSNINSVLSGDNQVQLGDSSTTVYTYATATRSDSRDKTDIIDCKFGLDFINGLKPKQYKFNYREDYIETKVDEEGKITINNLINDGSKKRNRQHSGLIAQDVKDLSDKLNIDFAGFQDSKINGGSDVLHLNYIEFLGPIIKAIQQLSQRVEQLSQRVEQL